MEAEKCTITAAAKKVGVEAHVLRYWEEELGLQIARNDLGHRCYTEEDIRLLSQVKQLKDGGIGLKAIRRAMLGRNHEETAPDSEAQNMDQTDGAAPSREKTDRTKPAGVELRRAELNDADRDRTAQERAAMDRVELNDEESNRAESDRTAQDVSIEDDGEAACCVEPAVDCEEKTPGQLRTEAHFQAVDRRIRERMKKKKRGLLINWKFGR
jgi:DNA-binding transcriptional MerR regulator